MLDVGRPFGESACFRPRLAIASNLLQITSLRQIAALGTDASNTSLDIVVVLWQIDQMIWAVGWRVVIVSSGNPFAIEQCGAMVQFKFYIFTECVGEPREKYAQSVPCRFLPRHDISVLFWIALAQLSLRDLAANLQGDVGAEEAGHQSSNLPSYQSGGGELPQLLQ